MLFYFCQSVIIDLASYSRYHQCRFTITRASSIHHCCCPFFLTSTPLTESGLTIIYDAYLVAVPIVWECIYRHFVSVWSCVKFHLASSVVGRFVIRVNFIGLEIIFQLAVSRLIVGVEKLFSIKYTPDSISVWVHGDSIATESHGI